MDTTIIPNVDLSDRVKKTIVQLIGIPLRREKWVILS